MNELDDDARRDISDYVRHLEQESNLETDKSGRAGKGEAEPDRRWNGGAASTAVIERQKLQMVESQTKVGALSQAVVDVNAPDTVSTINMDRNAGNQHQKLTSLESCFCDQHQHHALPHNDKLDILEDDADATVTAQADECPTTADEAQSENTTLEEQLQFQPGYYTSETGKQETVDAGGKREEDEHLGSCGHFNESENKEWPQETGLEQHCIEPDVHNTDSERNDEEQSETTRQEQEHVSGSQHSRDEQTDKETGGTSERSDVDTAADSE